MAKNVKFLGAIPLDLYRLGKKQDTTMDRIRDRDVKVSQFWRTPNFPDSDVPTGREGEVHMIKKGKQGGISLFDDMGTAPLSGKYWWGIKADKKLPPALGLWGGEVREPGDPKPNKAVHYTVYPLIEMSMDTFKLHLRALAVPMTEMFEVKNKID